MSFTDDYNAQKKKRKEKEKKRIAAANKTDFEKQYFTAAVDREPVEDIAPVRNIAPVKTTTKEKEKERTWFQKGAFEDGYQFGDVTKTILGTAGDVTLGAVKGVFDLGEGLVDLGAYGVAGVADKFGADDFADELRKTTMESQTESLFGGASKFLDDYSVLGDKSESILRGVGQVGGIILTGGIGTGAGLSSAGATALTTGVIGASGMGSGMSEAYQGGATDEEAAVYGLSVGAIEAGTEMLFGGLGKTVNAVGLSKGISSLDDAFAKRLSSKIANQTAKNFVEFGVKSSAEGFEEVLSGIGSSVAKKLTYMTDEELTQIIEDENLLEQFVVGAVSSSIAQSGYVPGMYSGSVREANKTGTDFITGLTQSEQKVIDKEYENRITEAEKDGTKLTEKEKSKIYDSVLSDMEKGYIDTDTIESVLGGEDYSNYQNELKRQQDIDNELKELRNMKSGDMTDIQAERMAELKAMKPNTEMVKSLKFNVDEKIRNALSTKDGKGSRLLESYNERSRRGQQFEADISKYDEKQKAIIQKAIDSGILNNTNRTHEFVDFLAKMSADKGVLFDFLNNEKLKGTSFARDDAFVNGYYDKNSNTIGVNIDSAKAVNSTVGHEITHVLEGTELYGELQNTLFEYAKTKGEYDSRRETLAKLYAEEDIDSELAADLVGDYLFQDSEFINHLSVSNRNVFQKVYDEIKYLYKVATAGSKQARELERVKRAFDKAYKEGGKGAEGTKYSMSDNEGKALTKEQSEYFKDSKVRDDNGNLMVMYHGSQDAGFHTFDAKFSDDDTSFFFVDRNDVAATYSGTTETYEAQTIRSAEDMNNFIESIGVEGYEVTEKDGKFTLLYDGERVAESDSAKGIYKEFCWYEGVGEGDANYKVYLNLKNPLEIDAQGRPWNKIDAEFSQEVYDKYNSLAAEEKAALTDLAEWEDFGLFNREIQEAEGNELASAYAKMGEDCNIYDLFSVAADNFSEDSMRENARHYLKTRDYAQRAKEQGYDGVIFKNIRDNGGYSNGSEGASTVAIAFESNQIKSVANDKPTADKDIRYSLSENNEQTNIFGDRYTPATELRYDAPIKETAEETVAPVAEEDVSDTVEYAPEIEPNEPSLYELRQRQDELLKLGQDAMQNDDADAINRFMAEYEENAAKIEQLEAEEAERFNSLDDADVPPEIDAPYNAPRGAITLDNKAVSDITKEVSDTLGLDAEDSAQMAETIQKYAQNENISESELFEDIKRNFQYHEETAIEGADELLQAKKHMRKTKLFVPEDLKSDFDGKRKDGYNAFRREHFGHFYLTTRKDVHAMGVDQFYGELNELYPDLFPDDVLNTADKLKLMGDIADMAQKKDVLEMPYDDETVHDVVDKIRNGIARYTESETKRFTEEARNSLLESVGVAPVVEDAPIEEPVMTEAEPSAVYETTKKGQIEGQTTMFEEVDTKTEKPIKTVKDRLQHKLNNAYGELSHNKKLRRESLEKFNSTIANLEMEYNSKKNKDTKVANDILRRIERLKRLRDDVDADYTKRINDNRARVEVAKTKLEEGYSDEEGRMMRSELHAQKIDEIKNEFSENGLDFDETLKNAKNLSTWATVDNTPQRVMEKSLGRKGGLILSDLTVNKVAHNESEGIRWLNTITSREGKGGLLKQLSKKYHIKPGSKESAAAQMYAEGFYVNDSGEIISYGDAELVADFPNAETQKNIKGLATDTRIRQFYDETLVMINESRTRNAYPEIKPLDNYFLHFRAMDDTFSRLGIPFNPNDIKAKDLPTDLNGVTADLKPGQPYFASAMHRRGNKTSYDLLGGMERYASGAKNQIYHIDDIQTIRALRNYIADTYGQANGLDDLDNLSEEEVQDRIKQVFGAHLSTFAKFLNEEANVIAGKTTLIDRGVEGFIGRRGAQFLDTVNKQVGSNMVGLNISSSLTNFLSVAQAFAKTNKTAFVKGFAQTVANKVGHVFGKADSFADNPTAIRRKGADRFYRTPWQKAADAGYSLMGAVDNVATEVIVRAKYNEFIKKGMGEEQAILEADKWASRLMGDRSLGQMPQLYNSKMFGLITKFQLEVRNQLDSQFYDTIQEAKASNEDIENGLKRNAKTAAKVAATFAELAIAQHIFGKVFESIAGYNPAFDIIDVLIKTLGFDDDEESEDTALDNIEEGFLALLEDLPYTSTLTGGRVPISSAIPIKELVTGKDDYGNEKSRLETLGEVAPYYLLPTGYSQLKKTVQGLSMFSEDHPIAGSYTDSGNLRFPVDDTPGNRIQAVLFGQWANENARNYFDNERSPLKEKQIEEFIDVDMAIEDYWKYRKGLSEYSKLAEKADYIDSLDLSVEQKNILINNIANRKEDIDMSNYGDYSSFEEFDFAVEFPQKYKFLQENGITYERYRDAPEEFKDAYTWAYNNPDKFTMSKAVTDDVVEYRRIAGDLYDIKADKDSNGKSIVGSRKSKVAEFINNSDLDYGARLILFKSQYKADDTYNYEIISYLNRREDVSFDDMKTILEELGFTVDSNGNITWD